MRRRSRFPAAEAQAADGTVDGAPRALWSGAETALREQVADHATAAGLELVDETGSAQVAVHLIDAAALTGGGPSRPGPSQPGASRPGAPEPGRSPRGSPSPGSAPLLVVTSEETPGPRTWQGALAHGARAVIALPGQSEALLSHLTELSRPRSRSRVIGVVAGHGGSGASSFAARLAAAARSRGPVVLIDADPLGGGLELLVEQPEVSGVRWGDLDGLGPEDGTALREGLPVVDEVAVLVAGGGSGPQPAALSRALSALAPLGGAVIADLSPALVPTAIEHLDQLLLVTTATDHAVQAAARRLGTWPLPAGLATVVVRRRGPLRPAEVAEDLGVPLAGSFRDSPSGTVPLLDVRRGGADRCARLLLPQLVEDGAS